MNQRLLEGAGVALLLLGLVACSGNEARPEYQRANPAKNLEIPPGLAAPSASTEFDLPSRGAGAGVSPQYGRARAVRDGSNLWLLLDDDPERVWRSVKSFVVSDGLEIKFEDQRLGILETEWTREGNKAPEGFFRGLIDKLKPDEPSSPIKDKYRVRLEREEGGKTELFVAHYRMEEVARDGSRGAWESRPSDPEQAALFLKKLLTYLGNQQAEEQLAKAEARPERVRQEGEALVLDDSFARAWRRVGLALDRVGLVVDDRDRSAGTYFVTQRAPLGKESRADDFKARKLRVVVTGDERVSRMAVKDEQGEALPADMALPLLEALKLQLR